jgi:hypothetical protein
MDEYQARERCRSPNRRRRGPSSEELLEKSGREEEKDLEDEEDRVLRLVALIYCIIKEIPETVVGMARVISLMMNSLRG